MMVTTNPSEANTGTNDGRSVQRSCPRRRRATAPGPDLRDRPAARPVGRAERGRGGRAGARGGRGEGRGVRDTRAGGGGAVPDGGRGGRPDPAVDRGGQAPR